MTGRRSRSLTVCALLLVLLAGCSSSKTPAHARVAPSSRATAGTPAAAPGPAARSLAGPYVKWVEGLIPTSAAYPMHPNALGEQAMAREIEAALR